MSQRKSRGRGSRPSSRPAARPAAQRSARPAPPRAVAEQEAPRVSDASVALFLAVVGLLTSLVLVPLSAVLGAAAVVVALLALRRGTGSRPALLAAAAVGALDVLLCALFLVNR